MNKNPKQVGTNLWDCVPQSGPCPNSCNQCFYNHGFYADTPIIPCPYDVGDDIVRMNSGHDSNLEFRKVIDAALKYKNFFFNTSIPNISHFPGPVVLTVNPQEELNPLHPMEVDNSQLYKIMFVRMRLSTTNLIKVMKYSQSWISFGVPVVMTFMHYYDKPPSEDTYEKKTHILNESWLPKRLTKITLLEQLGAYKNPLITMCGSIDSSLCKSCLNCVNYYWIAMKRIREYEKIYT